MKVVLFGAGEIGRRILEKSTYDVMAVIDNNPEIQGTQIYGKPVIELDQYKNSYCQYKIIISACKTDEIAQQLYMNGIFDFSVAPEIYEDADVARDEKIAHGNWIDYLVELCDKPGMRVLEVGSRNVTGDLYREKFHYASYTGFDYYKGENVDVVGDAHKLSSYFHDEFDLIFSSAVFEHLAMPWRASIEIIKLLKKGGYVFIETHYSFSSHERPWHFFQFSENALDVLFPNKFGMQCIKKGCSNLIEGKFSIDASEYLQGQRVSGLYCHSEYLGQKVNVVNEDELDWSHVSLEDIRKGTEYPKCKYSGE
ncbi:hypothetical protein C804_00506 [Lachnospiraceae bacterium A4]|jgi:predicted SAM-dependent methyltransferase|nr:hypothetical protein C804_00506 [Lachnospiraceae bacterium A4]